MTDTLVQGPTPAEPRLRRVLGFVELTASGVGIIIGAGIYVLLGAATAEAGAATWLAFGLAAILCGLTGLSYAELASMFPRAAAEYDYTRRVFPARWAFVVGWTMIAGLMVAAAAIAIGFAHYLRLFVDLPVVPVAMALLVVETGIAMAGIRRSIRLTVILSAVQILGLLAVVAVGVPHIGGQDLLAGASVAGVVGGAALVFFAFIGFDEVITLAEETRDPTRTVPRALLTALGISTVLYMAVAIAAVSVVAPSALARSSRPLADVVSHVLGGSAESAIAVIALVTTLNTSLLALTAASRLVYGMADSGALPRRLGVVSGRTGAPVAAVALAGVGAVSVATIGDLALIAGVTDFAVYIVFLAVNTTVVVLRLRSPQQPRPFHIPVAIARVPVAPVLGFGVSAAMIPQLEGRSLLLGVGLVVLGFVGHRLLDHS